jgi:hypothetical protein
MSACRMCDRCATVFSERAEGWSTYTGSVRRKNQQTGRIEMVSDELDACPECTELQFQGPTRPELATTVSPRYEPDPAPGPQ